MIVKVLKKTFSVLLTSAFVLLLVVAVYVSVGRQLLPYVGTYHSDIEAQLSQQLGQTVSIGQLEGSWRRFNPILTLHNVGLAPLNDDSATPLLVLDKLTLELSAWGSLRDRQLLLSSIDIENPELTLQESADGRWQLSGFEAGSGPGLNADQILDLAARVNELTLSNMQLTVRRSDGRSKQFERSRLRFQSRDERHSLHLDVWQRDVIGPLSLAAELTGQRIAELDGHLYVLIPETDYSEIIAGSYSDDFELGQLDASGEMWIALEDGEVQSVQGSIDVNRLAWQMPAAFEIDNLNSQFFVQRENDDWAVWLENFAFAWNAMNWPASNVYATYEKSVGFNLTADRFNLGIANNLLAATQVLGTEANAQLLEHNPRGELKNLDMEYRFAQVDASVGEQLRIVANLNDVAVSARGTAPAIWGIDGYTELQFDVDGKKLTGFAEVESKRMMFQLPMMFDDAWVYDYVNGRVSVDLDLNHGQALRLSSGVIVAESEAADGRAQFSLFSNRVDGVNTAADLELLVGISEGDISQKSIYLPMAPTVKEGMRNLMTWLDRAIVDGTARDSGLLYRGSVLAQSPPVARTMQMYFNVDEGSLEFDPEWPALESLNGYVLIDNGNVDISVSSGESLGIGLDATSAAIRPSDSGQGSLLTVSGRGAGQTEQALRYLQETPVTQGFGNYIADWQGQGNVDLALSLNIPLSIPNATPSVDVELQLQDDTLYIPEFELNFSGVTGQLNYNTNTGLIGEGLVATLFDRAIEVNIQSTLDSAQSSTTKVAINGSVDVPALRAWPLQSEFVIDLLARAEGEMDYVALLDIVQPAQTPEQGLASSPTRRLSIDSDLQGISLDYPVPFRKTEQTSLPLGLTINFLDTGEDLRVGLGDIATMNVGLSDGQIRRGLLFLGKQGEGVSVRRLNANAPGLDVIGTLEHFDYDEWMSALSNRDVAANTDSQADNFSSLKEVINAVDVTIADAYAFGQNAKALNVQIGSGERYWNLALASTTITGDVRVPYASDLPLEISLEQLVFPPAEEDEALAAELENLVGPPAPEDPYWDYERIDILADLDPRTFPLMNFEAEQVFVGDAPYGAWQFALEPNESGAVFSNLVFDTRGIRAGKEGEEGRVVWTYDGDEHHSYFTSALEADNLGAVLSNFGYAPSLESTSAQFNTSLDWPGSPAFFAVESLSGNVDLRINEGRFLQSSAGAANGALKLISIINFDALVRRLRFSDDLLRRGLSYEQIYGSMTIDDGIVEIIERLQIIGPASLFQVSGELDLARQTIDGNLYITLPISDNIPWMSGIAVLNNLINWQVAVGVFLFDQIFGDQVDSLTSAQYILKGPWEGLEPKLNQVFGTPENQSAPATGASVPPTSTPPPATP